MGLGSSFRVALRLELLLEWRSRSRLLAILAFSITATVISHYTLDPALVRIPRNLAGIALGTIFSASILLAGWGADSHDGGAFRLLMTSPLDSAGLYLARVCSRWTALLLITVVYVPANAILLAGNLPSVEHAIAQLAILLLVSWTMSALGALFSSLLDQRGRGVALPILMFPAAVPSLVLAAGALESSFQPQMHLSAGTYLVMLAPAALYSSLGFLLFPYLYEDGPFTS